ncbi:MAG: ferritin family protein [Chloroflexota bacterium]
MSYLFSAQDVLETAIQIEKNGAAFYEGLARSTANFQARGVYNNLVEQEHKHQSTFEQMLGSIVAQQDGQHLFEDRALFVKNLAEGAIFTGQKVISDMARRALGDAEAIQIGIGFEKDSILYYTEMRDIVRQVDRDVVDRVISEEKKHLATLSELLKKVGQRPQT